MCYTENCGIDLSLNLNSINIISLPTEAMLNTYV